MNHKLVDNLKYSSRNQFVINLKKFVLVNDDNHLFPHLLKVILKISITCRSKVSAAQK